MNDFFPLIDQYTDKIQLFLSNHVVLAPLVLLLVEEMGIPILVPGDVIIGYTGFKLSQQHTIALWQAFVLALLAVVCGASILFFIAKRWGQIVVKKFSHFIFLQERHLEKAEHIFAKYGVWAIIFGRHIPGLRVPITIFAATSGIKYRTFILSTIVSTALWILFYLYIGNRYGADIQQAIHKSVILSLGIILSIVVLVIGLHLWGKYRERKS